MEDIFLFNFYWDLTNAKRVLGVKLKSFPDFLASLSDERLLFYSNTVEKALVANETKPEDLQKIVLIYSFILKDVESKTEKNGSIRIAEDCLWISTMFVFITLEKFYRDGLIKEYSGFLYDNDSIAFKPSEEMKNMSNGMNNTLFDALKIIKNKK